MADNYKIEVFINKNWSTGDKIFTHYWTNEGENFFDSVKQSLDETRMHTVEEETIDFVSSIDKSTGPTEAYLEQFKEAGYSWVEIIPTKRQFEGVDKMTLQIDKETLEILPTMFFRVTGMFDSDFPIYYYSNSIKGVSDDNVLRRSYEVECLMDMWATFWIYMHHYMKSSTDNVNFLQKMCNRFIYNEQFDSEGKRIDSQGFIIDYLKQPYLMRTSQYEQQVFVNDDRENFLTLEEWLFINSGKHKTLEISDWVLQTWLPWINSPNVGVFNPKEPITSGSEVSIASVLDFNKFQNKYYESLSNGFYDTDFNSNSKYRYLICKIGSNLPRSTSTKDIPVGMFTNYTYNAVRFASNTKVTAESKLSGDWTSEGNYSYKKEVKLNNVSVTGTSICVYWNNWLINDKYITLQYDTPYNEYYVTWTDDLQLKEHRKVIENYSQNVEYEIIKLPVKSYAFDIYGSATNASLSINLVVDSDTSAHLVFRTTLEGNYDYDTDVTVTTYGEYTINDFVLTSSETLTSSVQKEINGETLLLIPFKKGVEEQVYLQYLNSIDKGITMGDGSVQGMPINDIPPSVLALAIRRQNNESDYQTIGDMLSVRQGCPLDIVKLKIGDLEMPSIFTGFDSVPITIATSPLKDNIYECVGGNKFFNYYYELLTRSSLTRNVQVYDEEGNLVTIGGNKKEVEPFLYSPQFWKWVYYIDGNHGIELTGDKIDFKKLIIDNDWEVKLNVTMNSNTNYFLDISEIKNNKYPMSKLGVELISGDPAGFPFSTEAYNNWLQGNQLTQETAKNAKDIQNEYTKKRGILDATVGAAEAGARVAGQSGGLIKGLIAGGAAAAAHAAGAIAGYKMNIEQRNKEFDNEWNGALGNYYSSPARLNPSGFTSGSLTYSPIKDSNQNSYELFRTFSSPQYVIDKVWYDIALNGYPFASQCLYKEYNNRLKFNIVNCNLIDRQYTFYNYLKEYMFKLAPLFATNPYIESFIEKCQDKFRVFKCEYDENNMEQIISENIELVREWVEPYFASSRVVEIEHEATVVDKRLTDFSGYEWSADGRTLSRKQEEGVSYDLTVPYTSLGVIDWDSFIAAYKYVDIGNKTSFTVLSRDGKSIDKTVVINEHEYSPEGIELPTVTKYIKSIEANEYSKNAIYVELNENTIKPTDFSMGWNVTLSDNEGALLVHLTPNCSWTFDQDCSSGTIKQYGYKDTIDSQLYFISVTPKSYEKVLAENLTDKTKEVSLILPLRIQSGALPVSPGEIDYWYNDFVINYAGTLENMNISKDIVKVADIQIYDYQTQQYTTIWLRQSGTVTVKYDYVKGSIVLISAVTGYAKSSQSASWTESSYAASLIRNNLDSGLPSLRYVDEAGFYQWNMKNKINKIVFIKEDEEGNLSKKIKEDN